VREDQVVGELKLPLLHLLQGEQLLPPLRLRVILVVQLYSQLLQVEVLVGEQVDLVGQCQHQVGVDGTQLYLHLHMEHLVQ
jgi:hypothetical protein